MLQRNCKALQSVEKLKGTALIVAKQSNIVPCNDLVCIPTSYTQGVFPPHTQCSQDRLWIHYKPD